MILWLLVEVSCRQCSTPIVIHKSLRLHLLLRKMLIIVIVIHHDAALILSSTLQARFRLLLRTDNLINIVNRNFRPLSRHVSGTHWLQAVPPRHMLQILRHRARSPLSLDHLVFACWIFLQRIEVAVLVTHTILPLPCACAIVLCSL